VICDEVRPESALSHKVDYIDCVRAALSTLVRAANARIIPGLLVITGSLVFYGIAWSSDSRSAGMVPPECGDIFECCSGVRISSQQP